MTSYGLEITLQSPLTSAAGEGRVGVVDRDVAFDNLGVPILLGRRLKGLWRDAYRDVVDTWQQCGQKAIPETQIFGESGRGNAYIHVANAELKDATFLREWLSYLQHPKNRRILPEDVVQHYASVRAQTSIDRQTGAALENTLRLTRNLNSDLVFWAPVHFTQQPNDGVLTALILGAAALKHMGTARTRGLGKVSCRFICNLTEQVLNSKTLPSITVTSKDTETESVKESITEQLPDISENQAGTATSSNCETPIYLLQYRLTLKEPVVIPVADGDPNAVMTRQDIPGSHLWGVAAWHYLRQANHSPADNTFRHAFLDGGLRFLTAYPEAADTQQRLTPIPHSIRAFKKSDTLIDFVEQSPGDRPTKRVDRRYARMDPEILYTQTVKTERNYHHARASKDRRIGRALGAEVPDGGALFTYEAIQAGQTFQGAVLGSEHDLNNLKTWLQNLKTVSIGRSRSAQYGKAEFEWVDSGPQELCKLAEWDGFAMQHAPTKRDGHLIVTALSPMLTVNGCGYPDARFPMEELATVLNVDSSKFSLSRSYTRTEIISGYHTHLRLPRQQWQAIATGSVFIFNISDVQEHITEDHLLQLEQKGLGLRKAEGYGRIAVNRQSDVHQERMLDDPDKVTSPHVPESNIHTDLQKLLRGVIRKRCMAEMQKLAMTVAARIKKIPSNSLLGRLRLFLQQDPTVAVLHMSKLRKPARDSLTECRINAQGLPNTLYALFEDTLNDPKKITERHIGEHAKNILKDGEADNIRQALIGELTENDSMELGKVFLNHLLTALYRR